MIKSLMNILIDQVFKETARRLKFINGVDDIFIGDSRSFSFNEQVNTIRDQYLFEH